MLSFPIRREDRWLPPLLALVALLPDLAAGLPLRSYYFRDFTIAFYPLRLWGARQLAAGASPFWNPYLFEGSFGLPAFYPADLLHVLRPGPEIVSWLLTLHLPLAALLAYALLRELGAGPVGAFVGGAVYALGGLALSSLNLYVFLEALALCPLLVLTLGRAAERGGRWVPLAGLVLALCLTTLAVEFVAQALALGTALALSKRVGREALLRLGIAIVLGLGLAAVPILVTVGIVQGGPRGAGLSREVALANAAHPMSLLQTLVPQLFGYLSPPAEVWWGGRFFTKGLPYFLSLYLGPLPFALAAASGPALPRPQRWTLGAAAILGVWYALGERGFLAPALSALPVLRAFRFPAKALFLPHLVIAILAGLGADRLGRGEGWRRFVRAVGLVAGLAAAVGSIAAGVPAVTAWLADIEPAFLPLVRGALAWGAVKAALLGAAVAFVALAVVRSRLPAARGAVLVAALAVLDLAWVGAGMNPQVAPALFRPLPEMAAFHLGRLDGGRVFSYGVEHSPAFQDFLKEGRPGRNVAAFFVDRQVLGPYTNLLDEVEVPEATDLTAFSPRSLELGPGDYDPARVAALLPWLRNAAVSRVLSLDPLAHPDLALLGEVALGVGRLTARVYGLRDVWPRAYLGCRVLRVASASEGLARPLQEGFDPRRDVALEDAGSALCAEGSVERVGGTSAEVLYRVSTDGPGYLVTRDSYAAGWGARVDGAPARVLRANGKHRAVAVPAGVHDVTLSYRAPGLLPGLVLTIVALAGAAVLLLRPVGASFPSGDDRA